MPRMLAALLASALALDARAGWFDQAGAELLFDDNLTRAQLERDIMGDTVLQVSGSGAGAFQLSGNARLALTYTLAGAAYRRYQGLDMLSAGLSLEYRWKPGLGPYVPQLRLAQSAARLDYRDAGRDSWQYHTEIGFAQRLSARLGYRIACQREQRRADTVASRLLPQIAADVYDLKSRNLTISADYALSPAYVLSAAYALRKGDILSTTLRNLPVFLASRAIAPDPVFGPDRYAYKMAARTRGLSLGVSRILGAQASATLALEHLDSRAGQGVDYRAGLVRASYLYQF